MTTKAFASESDLEDGVPIGAHDEARGLGRPRIWTAGRGREMCAALKG